MKNYLMEKRIGAKIKFENMKESFLKKRDGASDYIAAIVLIIIALGVGLVIYSLVTGNDNLVSKSVNAVFSKINSFINKITG